MIPIPSRVYNAAVGGHVTGTDQIIDDKTGLTLDKVAGGALEEKEYISGSNNGMGRVVLRKNMVNGVNTLTQSMIDQANTIYVIQYDFTLDEDITIPANCVLEFDGGSISASGNNDTITGNNTSLTGNYSFKDINLEGSFLNEYFVISNKSLIAENKNISDIISQVINETNILHFVITSSFNLTKAIRITKNCIHIEGRTKGEEVCTLTMKGTDENFVIKGQTYTYATPLIVYKPGETSDAKVYVKSIIIENLELRSDALTGESYDTYNRCGLVIFGVHIHVKGCICIGSMSGIKTPAIFCSSFEDLVVQGYIGFDGRVEIANATTMSLTNIYAVGSRTIGFYLKTWCYSTLVSTACDNSVNATCAYVFENCDIICNSIGCEGIKNTFIKQIGGNVKIQNGFVVGFLSTTDGCDYTQDGKYPFIAMLNSTGGYAECIINGLYETFNKQDNVNSGNITSIKPFYIESDCRLYINHSDIRHKGITTEYESEVAGKIITDESSQLVFTHISSLIGAAIVGNDYSGVIHVRQKGGEYYTKDMFNVVNNFQNDNHSYINLSTDSSDDIIFNCNTTNVVFKNGYFDIRGDGKLFGDNKKQNITFENCWIIVNGNGLNSLGAGSKLIFKDCWIRLSSDITNPFLTISNSSIVLDNTRVSGDTVGWLKATDSDIQFINNTIIPVDQNAIINKSSFALELHNCSHNIKLTTKPTVIQNSNVGLTTIVNGVMAYWNGTAWVDATGATV